MTLQVPDHLAAQAACNASELLLGLVVGLFCQGRLSLGQASDALGLSRPGFMEKLQSMGMPMPYSIEDAKSDLDTIARLWPDHGEFVDK